VTAIHTKLLPAEYLLRLAPKENLKERLELLLQKDSLSQNRRTPLFQAVLAATKIPARPSRPPRKINDSAMQTVS
jgi:hypothetical protein